MHAVLFLCMMVNAGGIVGFQEYICVQKVPTYDYRSGVGIGEISVGTFVQGRIEGNNFLFLKDKRPMRGPAKGFVAVATIREKKETLTRTILVTEKEVNTTRNDMEQAKGMAAQLAPRSGTGTIRNQRGEIFQVHTQETASPDYLAYSIKARTLAAYLLQLLNKLNQLREEEANWSAWFALVAKYDQSQLDATNVREQNETNTERKTYP